MMNDSNFALMNTTQGEDNFYLYNYDKLYEIAKSWKLENEVSSGDSMFVVDLAKSNAYYGNSGQTDPLISVVIDPLVSEQIDPLISF